MAHGDKTRERLSRPHLGAILNGQAAVYMFTHVGWVTRVETGGWWASIRTPAGDAEIIGEYRLRRDAFDAVVEYAEAHPDRIASR